MNFNDPRSNARSIFDPTQLNDAAAYKLVLAAQQYDDRALERIYKLYAERIFRHIYFRLADQNRAEELTGEVFVRLLENISAFQLGAQGHATALTAWIYRIAHNLIVDEYRRQKVRKEIELPSDDARETGTPEFSDDSFLARADLRLALKRLTDEQQTVILLRFGEEMTNGEIARILGKTETAVKALQRRALSALARHLALSATAI